jgi:intracellular proteinase inhibitor BsuPI
MDLFKTTIVAIGLQSCALFGAEFFPLQEGNTWTYREPATQRTFTMRIGQPVIIAGHQYYDLIGYADTDLLVRIEEKFGALVYWNAVRNQETLLTSFEQFEGGHWDAPFRPCPDQDGQGQLKLGNHDGPAGPIAGVLDIQYRTIGCADVGLLEEQYADHLGMLRRVVSTIAGPRTFDLIAARVGNITIDAAPSAIFSLSLGQTAGAGTVLATFRLHVNSNLPLTLSFASGQEYDFALKNSDGATLWKWSDSATFLQGLHQRIVADEWSATVEIPWPTTSGGVLQPGDYTVEAVVTNSNPLPFAATVPVTIAMPSTSPAASFRKAR